MDVPDQICNKEIKQYINCIKKRISNKPNIRDMKAKTCRPIFYTFIDCLNKHINEN